MKLTSGKKWMLGIVAFIALIFVASFVFYPGEDCSSLAREKYSGDAKFIDTHMANGDRVNGTVQQYFNGGERTVAYWECSTESGEPEITFYHPAG